LNNNSTKAAIHAPADVTWEEDINYPFDSNLQSTDTSPDPITFFTELASNASAKGVSIILYSGNDDSLVSHHSNEVSIQNTTFGGIQGFTRKPSTPWFDDDGNFAGIVHQERNFTYVLFVGASHLVPQKKPAAAYVFLREFVLGSNQTGLVVNSSSTVSVVGGEVSSLAGEFIPGGAVTYGNPSSPSTLTFPSATIAAWNSFEGISAGASPTTSKSFSRLSSTDSVFVTVLMISTIALAREFLV